MKRIKLEYDDIGALGRQNIEVWETIINKEARKADDKILNQAIKQGKPVKQNLIKKVFYHSCKFLKHKASKSCLTKIFVLQ